jgi:hypothetical protein
MSITRSAVAHGQKHLVLEPDPVGDRTVSAGGWAIGLHIAPFEALVTTVEVEHLAVSRFAAARSRRADRSVSEI